MKLKTFESFKSEHDNFYKMFYEVNEGFKMGERIKESEIRKMLFGPKIDTVNFLDTHFTGWIKIQDDFIHITHWSIMGIEPTHRSVWGYYDKVYLDGEIIDVNNRLHYDNYPNKKYMCDKELIKLENDRQFSEEDPYGEEDWNEDKIDFTVIESFRDFCNQ